MVKYRRSRFLLITLEESEHEKQAEPTSLVVTSIISGQHVLISAGEAESLRKVSSKEWHEVGFLLSCGLTPERIEEFVQFGVLYVAPQNPDLSCTGSFFEQEEILKASHWPPCAAAFHLLNHFQESRNALYGQLKDTQLREQESQERASLFLERYGQPPPEFYRKSMVGKLEFLPLEIQASPLSEALLRRRTCRYFEPDQAIALGDLASLLRLTFAPWGLRRLAGQLNLLLKTSPSGGSLHPIEAFPLIMRAGGISSGIYHYRGDSHSLGLVRAVAEEDLRKLAIYFAQGQDFVGSCSALVVLVARFDRNFWKYRERENSYAVVLQDAGHLSQTFQLVAADLGLGAFYTAAINSEALTEILDLRYPAEAPIGILGVGLPSCLESGPPQGIEPFVPRR